MRKITTLITIILFINTFLFAQLGEIKGIVKDEKGITLPGVTVFIGEGENVQGTATDVNGKYTLKPVKVGTHAVYASSVGYKKVKMYDVLVTSGNITYVHLALNTAVTEFEEFIVEEKMHEIDLINIAEPGVQHIIPKEFKQSVHKNNPIKAITSMTAGVTLAPNGKDVYIRGARPTSTQFITDGMKSITGEIGIPGLAVGSIKVYTGGIPSNYGDVTGGVIVVETTSYFDLAQKFK
jgi:hypothetical protein